MRQLPIWVLFGLLWTSAPADTALGEPEDSIARVAAALQLGEVEAKSGVGYEYRVLSSERVSREKPDPFDLIV
jgi:hypothetical protein